MVKALQNFWLRKRAKKEAFNSFKKLKKILIILLGCMISQVAVSQQAEEPVLYGDAKVYNLKYLRSLSSLEKSDEGERTQFVHKFAVDLNSVADAKVLNDTWLKSEPSSRAHNSNTLIPKGTLVKVYKNADNDTFLAVKFKNKWGFIQEDSIALIEK